MEKNDKYLFWRPYIWTGDLIEWQSKSVLGWLIRKFTKRDVNHTSLVIRFASFDTERVYILEALSKGVYPNLLSRRIENYRGKVYWLQLNPKFDCFRPSIAREGMKYVGVGYDYAGLIKQALFRVSAETSAFWCSEIVYQANLEAGLYIKQKYAPKPGDFYEMGFYKPRMHIL